MADGPLQGTRVADFSHMFAGPYCAQMLGDLGADVVKIESVHRGDRVRYGPPDLMKEGEIAYTFMAVNRNKRSLAVDVASPDGRSIVHKLIERADVFLHNHRRETVERLGLSYSELKRISPGIVYAAISGFGDRGPYKDLPGQDLQIQAMSGLLSFTGYGDRVTAPVGAAIADAVTGIMTAFAVLAALHAREKTGQGQEVDTSLLASLMALFPGEVTAYLERGIQPRKAGPGMPTLGPPFGIWPTKDGKEMAISTWRDEPWQEFCEAVGRPELRDDPRFSTMGGRFQNGEELRAILEPVFLQRSREEWIPALRDAGQWVVPVRDLSELCGDSHLQDNGLAIQSELSSIGPATLFGLPVRLAQTPATVRRGPPLHGEHTGNILNELGYSDQAVRDLQERRIVWDRWLGQQAPAAD